jgi:hypothetical protein
LKPWNWPISVCKRFGYKSMPVEIRELVIRAVIRSENNPQPDSEQERPETKDQQAIIEECVKQVLKILKRKQGR